MGTVFLLTLTQVCILFTFIVVGYFLNRGKVIKDARALSSVLMWVFLPAVVFDVFYKNFTVSNLSVALPYFIAGIVVLAVSLAIFHPIVKKYKDRITRNTYWYSMAITNMAYLGFPLVSAVFPELYLFFVVFTIGFHLYIFTVGTVMFAPEGKKLSLKGLLSPIMIALFLGLVCGPVFDLAHIKLPSVVEKIIGAAAGCMSPIAMLVTGFTLAKLPLKEVFKRWDVYAFTLVRLLAMPALFGGLAYLCYLWLGLPIGVVKVIIVYSALPMGLNTVVFVESNGGDGTLGAQCAFISHLLCLASMPLIFGVAALL